jgi:uncharacterized protein YecT (DUF1311 family)
MEASIKKVFPKPLCLLQTKFITSQKNSFRDRVDSILNVVYKQYSSCLSCTEKDELKKDELKWIKERDAYFKRADKDCADDIIAGEMPKIMRLINIQDKSAFIEERVIVLIKRMNLTVERSQH